MNTCVLTVLLYLITLTATQAPRERPVVTTPLGEIKGYHRESAGKKWFSAFEGIPYAKPPIREKRFEPPEPIQPWEGFWDATLVTECPQTGLGDFSKILGEEDCLHLNVYVPKEHPNPDDGLDVIVHIHGGFFMFGSGHSYSHPEYLMDENIIFVTFNYRLGILGFLSTGDSVVSGNNGLKDQVLALKWVQENIASFGGNPNSVTLMGSSAGASSVHYHYLSKMSHGLFHRGFSQSGVALNSFALQEEPKAKALQLAEALGCSAASSSVLVNCLKQRPFKHLLGKMPIFYEYGFFPITPFGPVLENGANCFVTKNPYYLLAKGEVQDLPWLTSTVSHEGFFPAAFFLRDLELVAKNWTSLAPYLLDFKDSLSDQVWKPTAEKIKNRYFGENGEINEESILNFVQMFTDRFLSDVEAAVKLQAKANKAAVYYYSFGYSGDSSTNKTTSHGGDARFFFYNMLKRQPTPNELKMKDLMMDMLTTFAKTGEPRFGEQDCPKVQFPEIQFLNVTGFEPGDIKLEKTQHLAPRDFWISLGFLENQNLVLIKDEL